MQSRDGEDVDSRPTGEKTVGHAATGKGAAGNGRASEGVELEFGENTVIVSLADGEDAPEEDLPESEGEPFQVEGSFRSGRRSKMRLGDILREMKVASDEQIEQAAASQKETGKRLGEALLDLGFVDELDLVKALGRSLGVPYIDLTSTPVDPVVADTIPEKLARRYGAVPVKFLDDQVLLVAMVDPSNVFAIDDLRIMTGYEIQPAVASAKEVFGTIARLNREESVDQRGRLCSWR